MNSKNYRLKEIIILAVVLVLFITASWLAGRYTNDIQGLIKIRGAWGMLFYFLITAGAVIIAPVSTLPLLPIAVTLWGSFLAAILTILGWTSGAMLVFGLSRRWGKPLIRRLVNLQRVEQMSKAIPENHLFWSVVFFRIVFPIDVFSYALGLFTKMRWSHYLLATFLGATLFAFVIAYAVKLRTSYQIAAGVIGLIIIILGYSRAKKRALSWLKTSKPR